MSQGNLAAAAARDHLDPEMILHIDDNRLQTIIAHPLFDEAMLRAAAASVSFYRGSWLLNRIANDRGRVIAALMMLDLHFAGGCCGFTVSQLREQGERYGVCSPNRMTALAALFRVGRLLGPVATADSRQRKLAPTQALFDLHRDRLRGMLGANSLIHPEVGEIVALLHENEVVGDVARVYLSYWRGGLRAAGDDPLLNRLADRDAAFTMLFLLMAGASRGESYRVSDLARQFAISRTHASVILREVAAEGCVRQLGPGGPYTGTPDLMRIMRPFFARLFYAQTKVVALTIARHGALQSRHLEPLHMSES